MKPILFSQDVSNDFLDRDQKKISIAIDSLQTDPTADLKVFVQLEPPSVKDTRAAVIANQHSFDLILAWHPDILDNCDNAKKFIFGSCWIDSPSDCWENKKDEVSFLTSNKAWAPGHKIRQAVFEYLKDKEEINNFSVRSIRTPPRIDNKKEIFKNAKYSIIIENEVTPNWITEKLIDCFITKTIPIYWGAPNVGEYFDDEGILPFSSLSDLERILNTLSSEEYTELEEVIQKNYNIAYCHYCDFHSRVDNQITLFLEKEVK
jgi:hypothetical protein|tara:strand:+ start:591 stop:1376 length:786 start_codon:yes stop_codon:yes gene_type:complete